jgi:hypothetical protein
MNGKDQCSACSDGGLVPARGCARHSNAHTYIPVICTLCDGTGTRPRPGGRAVGSAGKYRPRDCTARALTRCPSC